VSSARTPEEITAEIAETRNRLAATIDQLVYRAQPKTIAKRQMGNIKARFVDEQGRPKTDAIVKTAGVAVGVVATILVIRKLVG
jgi:Protein of unknown function (DUF3618)